ncbi:hypothetical protein [Microscilla marina]|uniref:Uncharacterized protein n=1 Tax=Microscilla marina ATCC 23134 TaxID=313606 RepID=A1ZX78_MICM2|nr:hypothetical protein [Microscilla marina]EAY25059.1 hypothetical protein M23134_07248 [Microscilla marina ATCC 23134]
MTSYKKDIENLMWVDYQLPQRDKNNYASFIKGYLSGKNDKGFEEQVSLYLNKVHQINIEYSTWIEQLDHYSYKQNRSMNLVESLSTLLEEMEGYSGKLDEEKALFDEEEVCWDGELKGEMKEQIQLQNTLITVGDYIQFADKIGGSYKQTKFYDSSLRVPCWDLFYPSERDFNHVYFYFDVGEKDESFVTFSRVRCLFSNSIIQIKSISSHKGKVILYSDLFTVELEKAFQEREIKLLSEENGEIEPTDFSSLSEQFDNYIQGISESSSLTETINKWCVYFLHYLGKPWHKFNQNMNGGWYERNK